MKRILMAAVATSIAALAGPAVGSANDADVKAAGKCTGSSTSKIKAKPRDGRLEVEFEVDQNRNGVVWKVRLKDNGQVAFKGSAKTRPPSGSFSIEKRIDDLAGQDAIKGIGRNPDTGEKCVAEVKV